jgi:hypothetical protein
MNPVDKILNEQNMWKRKKAEKEDEDNYTKDEKRLKKQIDRM